MLPIHIENGFQESLDTHLTSKSLEPHKPVCVRSKRKNGDTPPSSNQGSKTQSKITSKNTDENLSPNLSRKYGTTRKAHPSHDYLE